MKINMKPVMAQKQVLAPAMQQSIEVLMLPITELHTAVEQELLENPLLEVDEELTLAQQDEANKAILEHQQISQDSFYRTPQMDISEDEDAAESKPICQALSLEEYLLQQLKLEIKNPQHIKIGEFIIGNLDEDGYLTCTCEEAAEALGVANVDIIETILCVIQHFDPIGIASRDLKECLLNQVYYKCNGEADLVAAVIRDHLELLGQKKYQDIAKQSGLNIEKVKLAAQKIATLEPRPARNYRPIKESIYIKADLTIQADETGQYQVTVNKENIPYLRINPVYQKMLAQQNRSEEEKQFINEKIRNAVNFIRNIDLRHSTISQIGQYILDNQLDFLEHGHRYLKPMRLKDVAEKIGRNESTISRAVSNKYIDTPQGLLPLKFFFSGAINDNTRGQVSNRTVKEEIKSLISSENMQKPFSDQDIYHYLAEKGMSVSRRTITKYRQAMKILPSHLRKS